jgi:hypothetical protein
MNVYRSGQARLQELKLQLKVEDARAANRPAHNAYDFFKDALSENLTVY